MKKTNFLMGVFALMLMMQGCFKQGETTDERKAKENDEQIRQYLESHTDINAERQPDGLYIDKTEEYPTNTEPKTGDQVYVHYVGRVLNGAIFDSSDTKTNKPLIFGLNNNSIIYGFNKGVSLMRKGEKATIFVPSYLAYGNAAYDKIPAYSVLQFDLHLQDVLTEDGALKRYIEENTIDSVVARTSGLYFAFTDTTSVSGAVTPKGGEKVSVTYKGYFLNGSKFDESAANTPFVFTIGSQGSIKGFEEGITLMKVGQKATLMMPSSLAYGTNGSRSIPPYTPLIFEVELIKIE
ncbi:FKBP-type peptidyl-prolyl cis-trans isomerase [Rhodocytophaga rosea]|uniref:Peptidyl-prolyl cis-trans isomerase n=1 Tax=Rhodocytophaga rosea TaxID=2704465 RepID=A0A6C0GCW3_9BACT|nr:FKBP-type peptidyl-prolyl cis-trans isomerase [Rhodocytophaga rosea]QHT65811.1 FKBP-type peptidyl-prolyl cis-trans isomerase [Rhodocytophaga rosea]